MKPGPTGYWPAEGFDLCRLLRNGLSVGEAPLCERLHALLRAVRLQLGMETGCIHELTHGEAVLRYTDQSPGGDCQRLHVGSRTPMEYSLSQRVVDGRLPELIPDTSDVAIPDRPPVDLFGGIGAQLAVPLRLQDGALYGTFACFSAHAEHSLNPRDLALLKVFADVAGTLIDRDDERVRTELVTRKRIRAVLDDGDLDVVYQPIHDNAGGTIVGLESLARFVDRLQRPPDSWFSDATAIGLRGDLELYAIERGLAGLSQLPDSVFVACNVSVSTVLDERLPRLLARYPLERVVLEITEHEVVDDYARVARRLEDLRCAGLRVAVDDAGAGYASFRHILALRPDLIKLDISLTRDIDSDPVRRTLVRSLVRFAHDTGSALVAEGVETAAELGSLVALGVDKAQGYYLNEPQPMAGLRFT